MFSGLSLVRSLYSGLSLAMSLYLGLKLARSLYSGFNLVRLLCSGLNLARLLYLRLKVFCIYSGEIFISLLSRQGVRRCQLLLKSYTHHPHDY